jgi:hypothetical protein
MVKWSTILVGTIPLFFVACASSVNQDSGSKLGVKNGDDLPFIGSISPTAGAPGTIVEILGGQLIGNDVTQVNFEQTPGLVLSTADDKITVRAPALPVGSPTLVDITVFVGNLQSTSVDAFQYTQTVNCNDLPRIDSISPQSATNNETVSVSGAGFIAADSQISIGGAAATTVVQSENLLTISVPNLNSVCLVATCDFDMILQNSNGCQDIEVDGFTYERDGDGDGLSDQDEESCGSNPNLPDSDGDGLTDPIECSESSCDPNNPDSDLDGTSDKLEFDKFGDCVVNNDYDEDGFKNYLECNDENDCDCKDQDSAVNPSAADTANDGVDTNCKPDKTQCDDVGDSLGMTSQQKAGFQCSTNALGKIFGAFLPVETIDVYQLDDPAYANAHLNYLCMQVYLDYEPDEPKYWGDTATYRIESWRVQSGTKQSTPSNFPNVGNLFSYELAEPALTVINNPQSIPEILLGSDSGQHHECGSINSWGSVSVSSDYDFGEAGALNEGSDECDYNDGVLPSGDNYIRVVPHSYGEGMRMGLEARLTAYELEDINGMGDYWWRYWSMPSSGCWLGD